MGRRDDLGKDSAAMNAMTTPREDIACAKQTRSIPEGAWDCHTHVFGPPTHYQFDPKRVYTPGTASVAQLRALHHRLGIARVVIVQPSPYGANNRCTLDAVAAYNAASAKDAARAVVVIDAHADKTALVHMHACGARGIRINLKTVEMNHLARARAMLHDAARRIATLNWHVQVFASLELIVQLAGDIATLPVPVVLDHFAGLRAQIGTAQPGFSVLLDLLRSGNLYIKLSAAQRVSQAPEHEGLRALVHQWIACRCDRLLWGSDWPHPGAWPGVQRTAAHIEPFHPIDDEQALNRLVDWAGTQQALNAILIDNARRLYD